MSSPSIHRLGSRRVNWYIVVDDAGLVVIDTALPAHLAQLTDWLDDHGRTVGDIAAVLLTHGHADHLGFARWLQDRDVPVWIHADDLALAGERRFDLPPPRLRRNLWRPAAVGMLAEFLRGDISRTRGLTTASTVHVARNVNSANCFQHGQILDVPGNPLAVGMPGHTPGSTAFHFPTLDAMFTGDALMTLDPMKGGAGPNVFAARAADDWRSVKALTRLSDFHDADLYPGHGEPWTGTGAVGKAVEHARLG